MEYDKKFIIVGNMNSVAYKEFFHYLLITKFGLDIIAVIFGLKCQVLMMKNLQISKLTKIDKNGEEWEISAFLQI